MQKQFNELHFPGLFKFDRWSCKQVADVLQIQPAFEQRNRCLQLFAHIIAAQQIWHARVINKSTGAISLWPQPTSLEDMRASLDAINTKWQNLLENQVENLNTKIRYKNSAGTAYQTRLHDLLHHVIIHGQHHRAQIAMLLREADIAPPATDYIFYLRQNDF